MTTVFWLEKSGKSNKRATPLYQGSAFIYRCYSIGRGIPALLASQRLFSQQVTSTETYVVLLR